MSEDTKDEAMPEGQSLAFSRRFNSRSIASRMNPARPYVPTSVSIRSSISGAIRTGVGFILSGGLPIGRVVAGWTAAGKKTIPFSVDAINDADYINDIDYGGKQMIGSNSPKLSKRAEQALDILANGGEVQYRLERNSYTGREQFQTRFCASTAWSSAVKGLGHATRSELEKAGFRFKAVHRSSVSTSYALDHTA